MTWTLAIHHIGLTGIGDATLVVAHDDGVGAGHQLRTRTCLIDGGLATSSLTVHNYLVAQVLPQLDVMVLTHYDRDHMNGLRYLLRRNHALYAQTLVFDQGEPSQQGANDEQIYLEYVLSINSRGNRTRVTRNVASDTAPVNKIRNAVPLQAQAVPGVLTRPRTFAQDGPAPNVANLVLPPPAAGGPPVVTNTWWHPYWLVGRELLWTDAAGEPSAVPAGAAATWGLRPTITCVAANRYVRTAPTLASYEATPGLADGDKIKNEKSIAVEIRFGNFRCYVGGDLESAQEDTLCDYLNQPGTPAERVTIVKTSHHGSDSATSRAFVARTRPRVAVSSCGNNNQFRHPRPETVWTLGGFGPAPAPTPPPGTPNYRSLHPPVLPAAPVRRPIAHYLTGHQARTTPAGVLPVIQPLSMGHGVPGCVTSGALPVPAAAGAAAIPAVRGDVVVRVTQNQSGSSAAGAQIEALTATVTAVARAAGVAAGPPLQQLVNRATAALFAAPDMAAALAGTVAAVSAVLAPAAPVGPITAAAAAVVGGGPAAVVPVAYAAATAGPPAGAGMPAGAAAIVAATAGVVSGVFGGNPATVAAAAGNAATLAAGPAGLAIAAPGPQAAVTAAVRLAGLFTVTYYDRTAPPAVPGGAPGGQQTITFA